VDVTHTVSDDLHTGIQRVIRETVPRWMDDHELTLVAWDERRAAPFPLPADEIDRFHHWRDHVRRSSASSQRQPVATATEVVVPWRATWLFAEVIAEAWRADPYRALARARVLSRLGAIVHDLIPVTSKETV